MANLGYIQIIRSCNQHCLFCSNPENDRVVPVATAREQILELEMLGYEGVIFTGGEPTLHPYLPALVEYAVSRGVAPRVITNGSKIADMNYFTGLKAAGLSHVHVSLHSSRVDVQDFLTATPGSHAAIMRALKNAGELKVPIDVNTVINSRNADHLDETVMEVVGKYPWVRHFVWNNIDPSMNRVAQNPGMVAQPPTFELSLWRAMRFLESQKRTFRVERVPLCFMAEFAHCSTETRKIVKAEERLVNFLDEKGRVRQTDFFHHKGRLCGVCTLDPVCAGLYEPGRWYDPRCLHPLFLDSGAIRMRILGAGGGT